MVDNQYDNERYFEKYLDTEDFQRLNQSIAKINSRRERGGTVSSVRTNAIKPKKKKGFIKLAVILAAAAVLIFLIGNIAGVFHSQGSNLSVFNILNQGIAGLTKSGEVNNDPGWELILINSKNPVPENYNFNLAYLNNGQAVDERILEPLQNMMDDCRAAGLYPEVKSGYRDVNLQQQLYDREVESYQDQGYELEAAKELALGWVAFPNTSEHQIGIAVDINTESGREDSEEVFNWLMENCCNYGFILRYPTDKTNVTGINYEPWHYRYVGEKAAKEILERNITLEEYLNTEA